MAALAGRSGRTEGGLEHRRIARSGRQLAGRIDHLVVGRLELGRILPDLGFRTGIQTGVGTGSECGSR